MPQASQQIRSVCVYCGSSDLADPAYMTAAHVLGGEIAGAGLKFIYGGGGVGLMGASARGAHEAGGQVLGIIPEFLLGREQPFDDVETIVVTNMHERKMMMFEQADSFVVLPGGIGTLEEIVELLSWRRLNLHAKPIVFLNQNGFYETLFALLQHTIDEKFTPADLSDTYRAVGRPQDVVPAILSMANPPEPAEGPVELG